MGFVGEVMDSVQGIQVYYIIGLLIFIALFIVILTRTILMTKAELIEIKTAILENDNLDESTQNNSDL